MKIIEADQHYLRANPFNPFIRKNLAEAFYNVGDRNQACEELLKAIASGAQLRVRVPAAGGLV